MSQPFPKVQLTSELVEAFSLAYLSPRYDNPQPVPDFHRECWARYCSPHPACATAAPRNHAKSTGLTHSYGLASVCWRVEDYMIILGASEEKAIEHLGDMTLELRDNEELRRDFWIKGFDQDTKADVVVRCHDGHLFRILARGAEQKIRGTKWMGKRPGLILGDDLEDDEQVENKERRTKFRKWFFRAAKQALRVNGKIRVHGTILDRDSLLAHLIKNPEWNSRLYSAHRSYNDFRDILWPEQFSASRLQRIQRELAAEGDSAGYSQEYLNNPQDDENRYLKESYFQPIPQGTSEQYMVKAVGCDFAVSTEDHANHTSFTVGGKLVDNTRVVLYSWKKRCDSGEWVKKIFELDEEFKPDYWFPEQGQIWKTIYPTIKEEMRLRDHFIDFRPVVRVKDKALSGRGFQKEMKAGAWFFDDSGDWYKDYKDELLDFTPGIEGRVDDSFDSTVNLAIGLNELVLEPEDELTEEELDYIRESENLRSQHHDGRSRVTGY